MAVDLQSGAMGTSPDVLRQIATAVAAQDYERARDLAEAEISRGSVHPALYNARAMWLERQQRDSEALNDYQRSKLLSPNNPLVLNAIGLCFMRLFRFKESIEVFDEAIRANPLFMSSYCRKAEALSQSGDVDGALRAYERAASLDPHNADALAGIASIAAQRGDIDKAQKYATRAVSIAPMYPTAQAVLAQVDNERQDFASAERRVRPFLDDARIVGGASLFAVLGDALDGLNRPAEAFDAYTAENMELLRSNSFRFGGGRKIVDLCEGMLAHYGQKPGELFAAESGGASFEGGPSTHVFLLGFYRSGTTLLEQVLEAHPGIVTLEEREILAAPAERYLTSSAGLGQLDRLSGEALQNARDDYWRTLFRQGLKLRGKVFVDKHPLNTIKLPLIAKLFPEAKILFALRDPRDVILSCYRRHFQVNVAMYELLTLPGAARCYDAVMRLAALVRERPPLQFLECRYEEIVNDFEAAVRAVCAFIGVPYDASMENFSSVVRSDAIRSPSALQVKRGLYHEGVAQWRPYAAQLDIVAPLLDRWVDRFGYPAE